jgi:hypothetical protein
VNDTVNVAAFCVVFRFWHCGQEVCDGSDFSDNQPLRSPGAQEFFDGERIVCHRWEQKFGAYLLAGVCHLSSLVLDLAGSIVCVSTFGTQIVHIIDERREKQFSRSFLYVCGGHKTRRRQKTLAFTFRAGQACDDD